MRHDADQLVPEAGGRVEEFARVAEAQVDFFVQVVERNAGSVGDAVHGAEDEGHGPGGGNMCFLGGVELLCDVGDGVLQDAGWVDESEETARGYQEGMLVALS